MENNFFVGDICHSKRNKSQTYIEKVVLYSNDNFNYLDPISGKWYTTNDNEKNYVISNSIIPTNINDYRENYIYLLSKYTDKMTKKKRIIS